MERAAGVSAIATMIVRLRIGIAFLLATVVAFAIDGWLRFVVLPRHPQPDAVRVAAFNRATRRWGTTMYRLVTWALRLRVDVHGAPPPPGRYLVVANHQSSLDVPFLIANLPGLELKFVAMQSLGSGKPAISILLRHGGSVCVTETNIGQDLLLLSKFAAELPVHDGSPMIFPAGVLERDEGPRPWRLAGIEAIRRVARLPILPVAIDGLQRVPSIGSLPRIAGGRVTLRIYEPVPCEEADRDPRALYDRLEQLIRDGEAAPSR